MQKVSAVAHVMPKRLKTRLRRAVAEYLRDLPESEMALLKRACRKQGLNVRVDKRSGGV